MRKIFLSLCLVAAACLQAKPAFDFCLGGIYYRIDQNAALVTKGDAPYVGDVTIPEQIGTMAGEFAVTGIDAKAFYGSKTMTSVTYPATVTTIGENAFTGCESLKHFTISPQITFIAKSAFENSGLEELTIPATVANIGDDLCKNCKVLKRVIIENKQITEEQFANCPALESVTISDNVLTIKKKAFFKCTKLGAIELPQSVTMIEEKAFSGCIGLTEFHTSANLQVIRDEAFLNCSNIKTIDLGTSLTHIGKKAFSGTAVEQLFIPASIKTFGDGVFFNCKKLQSVELDNATLSDGEFQGCENLSQVVFKVVPNGIPKNVFNGCVALTAIPLPEGIRTIDYNAFHGCKGIKEITLPSTIEQIANGAFSGCAALNHIRCLAAQVPTTSGSAFTGIAKDGLKIEVPAVAIEAYKAAPGWKQFQPKEGQVFFPIE